MYYDTAGPIRAAFIKMAYDTVGADQILWRGLSHGALGATINLSMTLKEMEALENSSRLIREDLSLNAKKLFENLKGVQAVQIVQNVQAVGSNPRSGELYFCSDLNEAVIPHAFSGNPGLLEWTPKRHAG